MAAKKRKTGGATFTAHIAVAVSPEMKRQLEDAAEQRQLNGYGVVARWALAEWLERNYTPRSSATAGAATARPEEDEA